MAETGTAETGGLFAAVGGLRLHYLTWGRPEAPPLLLLHGIRSHAHAWDVFAPRAAASYRVVAPDGRGHGDSEWAREGRYDAFAFSADLEGLRAALGFERPSVIAHSLGGLVALTWLATTDALVDRLVLVDIGPEMERAGLDRISQQGLAQPASFASAEEALAWAQEGSPRAPLSALQQRTLHGLRKTADGRWTFKHDPLLRDLGRLQGDRQLPDFWTVLSQLECQTLVVRGAESDFLSPQVAARMVACLRNGQLVEVLEAGHSVPLDNPDGFARAVAPFLGLP